MQILQSLQAVPPVPQYPAMTRDDDGARSRPERARLAHLRLVERALHGAANSIIICDARREDLPMTYVNAAFEQLTGYRSAEVLGLNCRMLNDTDRDQPALQEVRDALRERRGTRVVLRNYRKDGSPFWNELTLSPMFDAAGELTHYIGTQVDVTERMEFAAERERLLAETLAERQRAERAATARDRLLAVVSHELRSPLNGIRLWTSLLQDTDHPDQELVRRAVANIESGVTAQARILEDLLDATRLESGGLQLERTPVDLVPLARRVVERNAPAAVEQGQQLTFAADVDEAIVLADRGRIEQVLQNLIDNARKFSEAGAATRVEVAISGDSAQLRVRDQGRGIAADDLGDLFDRFWQGARTGDREQDGLGLGLHLVRHLVEHQGGRVEAHSDGLGTGAELRIELPLHRRADDDAEQRPATSTDAPLPAGDLLVVDDDPATAEALALGLRMAGYEPRVARDVPTALAELDSRRPRALVSDLGIGTRSGFELAQRLRRLEFDQRLPRTPAIAISGRDLPEDARDSRAAGFDRYLRKPVAMRPLVAALRALLEADKAPALDVLIVHGDRQAGERLRELLLGHGHSVQVAPDAAAALAQIAQHPVDAVVATATLPDGDGETLHASVQQTAPQTLAITLGDGDDPEQVAAEVAFRLWRWQRLPISADER